MITPVRREDGFTLIELLVAGVPLGSHAVVSAPLAVAPSGVVVRLPVDADAPIVVLDIRQNVPVSWALPDGIR